MTIRFYTTARRPWGAEHSLVLLLKELAYLGETVEVWCCSEEVREFITTRTSAVVATVPLRNRFRNLLEAVTDLRRTKPNVAVVFSLELLPLAIAYRLANGLSSRAHLVFDVHDVPKKTHVKAMLKFFTRFYTHVIAISEYTARQLDGSSNVHIIPRPIPPARVVERPVRSDGSVLNLAILGRIDPEKRVDLAIRATGEIPEVRLHVFGEVYLADSDYESSLRTLSELVAPGRVFFAGYTPIDQALRAADTLVVCNENEPSGRTVGEALVRGVDVIVPDSGGSKEYIGDGLGLVYQGADVKSLISALKRRIEMPEEEIDRIRTGGRDRVLKERSVSAVGLKYRAVLTRRSG